ncbi:hypothetical protein IFO69_08950 [Echinicola sp. CAU 1574]|uniref:Uncharacterized protein n=1 Tax=Echinicola arenosa TaxID=2774144 RepID=A0ABR9ALU7_9BACT|nr:hypothetical protein [Echinicola arenosa]MBD8488870.1 hypothetical protein [Echinicola arenosa]
MDREEINSEIHKIVDKIPDEIFEGLDDVVNSQKKNKTKLLRFTHRLNKILREDKKIFNKLSK